MATATRDPVLRWADQAKAAGTRWGVDPAVLLGLVDVESGGDRWAVSPAGARWLTQFMPGTAQAYHVTGDSTASQLDGAAHYLHDLGFSRDPSGALAKYNGGPGNPQPSYAQTVLARARRYAGLSTGTAAPTSAPPATMVDTSAAAGSSDDPSGLGGLALKALLWLVLIGAGAALTGLGVKRLVGPTGAQA